MSAYRKYPTAEESLELESLGVPVPEGTERAIAWDFHIKVDEDYKIRFKLQAFLAGLQAEGKVEVVTFRRITSFSKEV